MVLSLLIVELQLVRVIWKLLFVSWQEGDKTGDEIFTANMRWEALIVDFGLKEEWMNCDVFVSDYETYHSIWGVYVGSAL